VALVSQNGEWFAGNRGEKVVVGVYFAGKTWRKNSSRSGSALVVACATAGASWGARGGGCRWRPRRSHGRRKKQNHNMEGGVERVRGERKGSDVFLLPFFFYQTYIHKQNNTQLGYHLFSLINWDTPSNWTLKRLD
jgi:hypothetical protein